VSWVFCNVKYQVRVITVFTVFRLLTDFVCLYTCEFWLSLCKIPRSSVILLLPLFNVNLTIHTTCCEICKLFFYLGRYLEFDLFPRIIGRCYLWRLFDAIAYIITLHSFRVVRYFYYYFYLFIYFDFVAMLNRLLILDCFDLFNHYWYHLFLQINISIPKIAYNPETIYNV
jgi:hypothetical protein